MKIKKDIKSIIIAGIALLLVASCFQPTSFAQGSEGHIINIEDEINGDEITIFVQVEDFVADGFLSADEYKVRLYDTSNNLLDEEPDFFDDIFQWINIDGEQYTFKIRSDDGDENDWNVNSLEGGLYRVELWEEDNGHQDTLEVGVSSDVPYDPNIEVLNIVQITDTHIKEPLVGSGNDPQLQNVISKINMIKPDLTIICGDLVDFSDSDRDNFERYNGLIDDINHGVFYNIIGNHDIRSYDIYPHFQDHSWDGYHEMIDTPSDELVISDFYNEYKFVVFGIDSNQKNFDSTQLNDYSGEISDYQIDTWLPDTWNDYDDSYQAIIFMHHPVFACEEDYFDILDVGLEDPVISDDMDNRDDFIDYCQEVNSHGNSKVSLVLTGHTHSFGVWEEDGADPSGHYQIQGKRLSPTQEGYSYNFNNKKTKYIHTCSVKDNTGYRLIQLYGENAIYRHYSVDYSNPLPEVLDSLHLPVNPFVGGAVNIYASIDGGTPDVEKVRCYWSMDENNWDSTNYIDMNHLDGTYYKTSSGIDTSSLSIDDTVYYKIMVENKHNYLYVSEIESFTIGEPKGLDLIFVVDTTGSMGDDIAAVKSSATDIINEIDSDMSDYRIAVVDYRDFPISPYGGSGDYEYNDVLAFSSDKNTIISAIQSLSLGWGADWRESVYSALIHAIDSTSLGSWRGEDIAAKMIILMCDAPPHDPEPFTGYTLESVVTAAENADPVHIYPIQIGGAVEKMQELAEQTGGELFTAASASEIVATILDAIEEISTNPSANADGPYETSINTPITLDGTASYDLDGIIISYEWDLDDDGEFDDAIGPLPSVIWDSIYDGEIHLKITDNDGLTDIDTTTITITGGDVENPQTIKTIGQPKYGIDDIWITTNTEFNLSASDDFSGVDTTYYRIWYDGSWSTWIVYNGNFTLSFEGKHYIEYYSTDNAGNIEEIHNQTHYVDNNPPDINIIVPGVDEAVQDGITIETNVTDLSGVDWVKFSIRNPNGETGTIINSSFESLSPSFIGDDIWQLPFDSTQLPDGYYLLFVNASDMLGNKGYKTVNFSIRNWAVLELLPNTASNKAGRTMPVKFSLRIVESVDPEQPFVRNEELNILIYEESYPDDILQNSTYGNASKDYRINSDIEHYITNFKTSKTPKTYIVEIWRKDMLIGSFNFETVK